MSVKAPWKGAECSASQGPGSEQESESLSSESSASGSGSVPPSGVAGGVWLSRKDIREAADRDNYRV